MNFNIGNIFYLRIGLGKPYRCQIVAIIENDMIVYKWFGRHKRWWHYRVEDKSSIEALKVEAL